MAIEPHDIEMEWELMQGMAPHVDKHLSLV
jgi:hypothetical protein